MKERFLRSLSFCRELGKETLGKIHRLLSGLIRDHDGLAYWRDILSMTAAASFAVAFFQFNPWALVSGIATAIGGIKLNRLRRMK
jgi:hypothetical protein